MAQRLLLIRLFEHGGSQWGLFAAGGDCLEGPSDGLPAPDRGADARVVVLAPGERVLLTAADVPTRNPARLRRALPFAIEDRLAADVDSLHVAAGARDEQGTVGAAVVARALLDDWLARLASAGLQPDSMVPEPLALPREDGGTALLLEADRAVARLGATAGWAGEADLLPVLAPAGEVTVYAENGQDGPGEWRGTTRRFGDAGPLGVFARGLDAGAIELLQGDYARGGRATGASGWWRAAAVALLAWGLLELGLSAADTWRLSRESQALQQDIRAVFRQALPDERLVDPRTQMAQALGRLSADGGDALALMRDVAPVLSGADGLSLESLEYRDGELSLSLRAGSLAQLDRVQSLIAARPGLRAELGSASASERGVDGRLVVRRSGA